MAKENLLSDARVRSATKATDGGYLADGGGLRVRLMPPSREFPEGARLFEYHFKLKTPEGEWKNGAMHLGTYGEESTDAAGKRQKFGLVHARTARDAARGLVAKGVDPREARRLRDLEDQAEQKRRLAELQAEANRKTVRTAFKSWVALFLQREHKDGGALVESHFARHVLPSIGDAALQDIGKSEVMPILDKLVSDGRLRTANVVLALLRQFFRWCMTRDWIDRDPTFGLSKKVVGGADESRERNLSFDEVALLPARMAEAKLPDRLRAAVWLLLATGARAGELAGARLADFDLEAGEWRIPAENAKNGVAHLIHLSPFAAGHVKALVTTGAGSPWLLAGRDPAKPIDAKTLTKQIRDRQRPKKIKGRSKQAGALLLPGGEWTPHDLRRTMASRMQDIGVAPQVIEKCLNHTLEGVLAVYQRADLLPERKAAYEAWGAKIEATLRGDGPTVVDMATAKAKRTRTVAA